MRGKGRIRKLRSSSLLSGYLLIIVSALLFIPVILPLSFVLYNIVNEVTKGAPPVDTSLYSSVSALETMWHKEALQLQDAPSEAINERLQELSQKYTEATMFWVDGQGMTQLILTPDEGNQDHDSGVPEQWSAAEAISFMKESTKLDPLAIVAFVGDRVEAGKGFMVMQIPNKLLNRGAYGGVGAWALYYFVLFVLFGGFALVSLLFFRKIRKRLLQLQTAMTITGPDRMPKSIMTGKLDEIGRLEEAFNTMVAKLDESRRREIEEEELRKRLVSNLSHDLRTPLTVIRSHIHVMTKESLTPQGQQSLQLMDKRIADLSVLIENLLSYNLLNSGRITLKRERKDVLRLLRESAAAWYPVWEKENFEIDIDLEAEPLFWMVDEVWFRRILDNLFQNIVRHASSGLYVGISTESRNGQRVIMIKDHGRGIQSPSDYKGAGLGLSIVDLLMKHMELEWDMESTEVGTSVVIFNPQDEI
ncbi:HAMP domain-containing sensor histidine kinase [Paenibacillus sp. FSL R10-2734]|uniref:HAMP domain-containing sensor histidine kinase n=1 Tax=Paenibacillus sp. FSL R10-2734 TaxID=2954691 RepID=UPI0030D88E85